MQYVHYIGPKVWELKKEGWVPRQVSGEAQTALYNALTHFGSPYRIAAEWYLDTYGNMSYPCRKAVGAYAYGLGHMAQFGNNLEQVVCDTMFKAVRDIMHHYNTFSGVDRSGKYAWYTRKFIDGYVAVATDGLMRDARDQLRRVQGEGELPFWWKKPKKEKRVRLHKGKAKGGSYRIERLADLYD